MVDTRNGLLYRLDLKEEGILDDAEWQRHSEANFRQFLLEDEYRRRIWEDGDDAREMPSSARSIRPGSMGRRTRTMSSFDRPLVINDKTDFRYEAEVYSASVSVPVVPAYPKWLPARMDNPFVDSCKVAGSPGGRFCIAKPALDYGSFDGLEPKHITLYLAPRGLWSQDPSDALRLCEASAVQLLTDWPSYASIDGATMSGIPSLQAEENPR